LWDHRGAPLWLRVSQDIDFVGSWDPMIPDAEIISLLGTVLTKLEVGEFTIKVGVLVGFQDRQALTQMLLSAES
jgi:histidyl-tRNA synthetase